MGKINLVEIINEEISKFDFLGNDERQELEETVDLLSNEDLQKQFICDSLLHRKEKIKQIQVADAMIGGDWEMPYYDLEAASKITLLYDLDLEYLYDQTKEPVKLAIRFESENIPISLDGWYDKGKWGGTMADAIEPSGEAWFDYLDYSYVDVKLYSIDGDEVEFNAFEKAPAKIQTLFIREYVEGYIRDYTKLELRTDDTKISIENAAKQEGYC